MKDFIRNSESPSSLERLNKGKMKRKLIKINTVLIRRGNKKLTPLICISGLSLNVYGFEVGRRFEVYAQKGQLVLKAKEFKYKNPIIKEKK